MQARPAGVVKRGGRGTHQACRTAPVRLCFSSRVVEPFSSPTIVPGYYGVMQGAGKGGQNGRPECPGMRGFHGSKELALAVMKMVPAQVIGRHFGPLLMEELHNIKDDGGMRDGLTQAAVFCTASSRVLHAADSVGRRPPCCGRRAAWPFANRPSSPTACHYGASTRTRMTAPGKWSHMIIGTKTQG
jgi:hypothetical protein